MQTLKKNRGAITNPEGRFENQRHESYDDGWNTSDFAGEVLPTLETTLLLERSKTIITRNDSPDISFDQSINPYRGCEHGCIYCYARPSHSYVNLSPGLDFETTIFYKSNAALLLEQEINKPGYRCQPIVIGANTDPYQPAESKLNITRSLLSVAAKYNHPIAIITKGALIARDFDILAQLAEKNLVRVAISLTTLSPDLKKILEPRAASVQARLRIMRKLTELGIPVTVMAAPIIPMINDMELEHILKAASTAGAQYAGFTLIRLPFEVKDLFKEWLNTHYPERAEHIMSLIRQMRGGKEYNATFGSRMRGEGKFAQLLTARFKLAARKFHLNQGRGLKLTTHLFSPQPHFVAGQLTLNW